MTQDAVVATMGDPDETIIPDDKADVHFAYLDQSISAFTGNMTLIVRNNALISRAYIIDDSEFEVFTYLENALEIKYGKPTNDISALEDAYILIANMGNHYDVKKGDLAEQIKSLVSWGASIKLWGTDDTNIALIYNGGKTVLMYFQRPGYNFDGL